MEEAARLPDVEWSQLMPELVLVGAALALLIIGTFTRGRPMRGLFAFLTLAATTVALTASAVLWDDVTSVGGGPTTAVADALVVDGFSVFFTVLICIAVALGVLLSDDYLPREGLERPAYYVLMLLSASGGILMAKANDLILVFLGLEVLSIALYVLCGYHRGREQSREAAIKYFVLGAFSSAFLLYGIALTYGATGTTNLGTIAQFLRDQNVTTGVLLGGFALLLVGFGFKVAAVPFHMWTPDVYQGAPTPVTGFMAAAAKAAGFAALLRVFYSAFATHRLDWQPMVWALAVLSLVLGSVLAVVQTDVKRMLAYSSISHAGYILIGLEAATDPGIAGSLFYLLAYTFMILGSFAVVTLVGRRGDAHHDLQSYRGLAQERPGLALAFTIFLLAQAGVPFTAGFLAKFYVISAAVESRSYALAIIAMLAAVVAAFFYLRLIVVMYMAEDVVDTTGATSASAAARAGVPGESRPTLSEPVAPEPASAGHAAGAGGTLVASPASGPAPTGVNIPPAAGLAIAIALAFTVGAGLVPEPFIDFARRAVLLRP